MSGFAGALRFDRDKPFPVSLIDRQIAAISARGPTHITSWSADQIQLVHSSRDNLGAPEHNLREPGMSLFISADMRLDNRKQLTAELGLPLQADPSDVDLLKHAYLKWGVQCCRHLYGDFAFALWDTQKQRLLCARDQLGVKPAFYAKADGILKFGSALPAVNQNAALNRDHVASFLMGFIDDGTQTSFSNALRIPPGHHLLAENGTLELSRYWTLPRFERAPDGVLDRGFGERLEQAVSDRLRGTAEVGALLSGGLDSSTITALAARNSPEKLKTFSFHYPQTPQLDEGAFVDAVLSHYPEQLRPTRANFDSLEPLGGLPTLMSGDSDLVFAPGLPKMTALFSLAASGGVGVLLDGHGGDEVASHGLGRLKELALAGQWLTLRRELQGVSNLFGDNPNTLFIRYFSTFGPARHLKRLKRYWRTAGAEPQIGDGFLNHDFAQQTDIVERRAKWSATLRSSTADEAGLHHWNMSNPAIGAAFEALDRAATVAGVELRFPFFDRRLVEFAVNLPAKELLQDGWSRSILRRSMAGILPDAVRWRRDKIDFGQEMRHGLVRYHLPILQGLRHDNHGLGRYLDLARLGNAVDRLIANPAAMASEELFGIWRAIAFSQWLSNRSNMA